MSYNHDVTVIGEGWSGLVACKYMLEEGLSVVAIEKREGIRGVWRYSDGPSVITVMKSTCCSSSSTVTEMSVFPMPEEIGMFPHNIDVREYLEYFNLIPHIRINTSVPNSPSSSHHCIPYCRTIVRGVGQEEKVFEASKGVVISESILVHFNPKLKLVLACNTSGLHIYGIPYMVGAVLAHRLQDDQSLKPIGYVSRSIPKAELHNYSQLEKKGLYAFLCQEISFLPVWTPC